MISPLAFRQFLQQEAWSRREYRTGPEQEGEIRQMERAFRHTRVLLSRARLKAELYLQRN